MKRFILLFLSLSGLLLADFVPALKRTVIDQTDGKTTQITAALPVGMSGIVIHNFDNKHKTIVAQAVVTAVRSGKSIIQFKPFKRLRQSALPDYDIKPAKGDTIILGYLYNRVLPVTPDKAHYDAFVEKHRTQFDIIHPDLFASQLYFDYQPRPDKDAFRQSCLQNDTALLYFAIDHRGYFVDCNSFKVIASEPLSRPVDAQKAQKPFYSRIRKIKNRLGGLLSDETIRDYNRYYKRLLELQ